MKILPDTTVADIAATLPATIPVFQRHHIDFCCGGKKPLSAACDTHGLSAESLIAELEAAQLPAAAEPNWQDAPLSLLIRHIQARYHEPLRDELPRLAAMVAKVVDRHGDHLPETLRPLQQTFSALEAELLEHMRNEDKVLFPLIEKLEAGTRTPEGVAPPEMPIEALEHDHARAGEALAAMRALTHDYTPPEWACPTFRGLYYGLAQFESDMHLHVHLENNILFRRAAALARAKPGKRAHEVR